MSNLLGGTSMKFMVSGLVNIETNVKVREFPIPYYPIDFNFFGIESSVGGVGYNISKALKTLGDEVDFYSFTGDDEEALRIQREFEKNEINTKNVRNTLKATPVSIALFDESGRRQIYCDLKDIQENRYELQENQSLDADVLILCNINFNRDLLKEAKTTGKLIATDVHVLDNIEDEYNKDFMEAADILFLSDEAIPCEPYDFITSIKEKYKAEVIVMGCGKNGVIYYDRRNDQIDCMKAYPVEDIVNTIGAGDALFSSFLHFYVKGNTVKDSLAKAQIFAGLKIRSNGAAEGFVTEDEVEHRFYES